MLKLKKKKFHRSLPQSRTHSAFDVPTRSQPTREIVVKLRHSSFTTMNRHVNGTTCQRKRRHFAASVPMLIMEIFSQTQPITL
jgi:hypothetical protein